MSNVLLKMTAPGQPMSVTYFLHPGKLFASRRPCRVTTILGSCVSVCLYDVVGQIGGVNHFILPESAAAQPFQHLRFGDRAIPALLRAVLRHGADRRSLVAKVFGGASITRAADHATIGAGNIDAAVTFLAEHDIPIVAEDVGGHLGRKLIFDTATGDAFVKRL